MGASSGIERITGVVCDGTGLTRDEVRLIGVAAVVSAALAGLLGGAVKALRSATHVLAGGRA